MSGLSLHCVSCLQPQIRYMRQCRCLACYCEGCARQGTERCPCGQNSEFIDLFAPNEETGAMLTMDTYNLLKKLLNKFQKHMSELIQDTFSTLNRIQITKEANLLRYIQTLERQLAAANAEKDALKGKLQALQSRPPQQSWSSVSREHVTPFSTFQTPLAPTMRQIVPRTSEEYREKTLKRPFSHEAFGAFFRK